MQGCPFQDLKSIWYVVEDVFGQLERGLAKPILRPSLHREFSKVKRLGVLHVEPKLNLPR
jgi:hypothetical protein